MTLDAVFDGWAQANKVYFVEHGVLVTGLATQPCRQPAPRPDYGSAGKEAMPGGQSDVLGWMPTT